jgi:hypothetical protein
MQTRLRAIRLCEGFHFSKNLLMRATKGCSTLGGILPTAHHPNSRRPSHPDDLKICVFRFTSELSYGTITISELVALVKKQCKLTTRQFLVDRISLEVQALLLADIPQVVLRTDGGV